MEMTLKKGRGQVVSNRLALPTAAADSVLVCIDEPSRMHSMAQLRILK
jgi:hypothetical protein